MTFQDQGLLHQALVHRSYINETGGDSIDSYERMEFLGDSVLELVISSELYQLLPGHSEGDLTKGRASLVCRESLAGVARRLGLGDFILLGHGEEASQGRGRDSTLAAAMEAVTGAVYLDQGLAHAKDFILRSMAPEIDAYLAMGAAPANAKSLLQERVQGQGIPGPEYRLAGSTGPDHDPVFTVEVVVDGNVAGRGQGGRKADAEREAARNALENLDMQVQETRQP